MARRPAPLASVGQQLVFLDASVLVAASRSPSGGSALVLEVCRGRRFRAALTTRILLEARVNIAEKFGEVELLRFYQQLAAMNPELVPPPPAQRMRECVPLTTEKDAHVLAAALECGAGYLLTLDRRHLITPAVQATALPLRVMTPGDLLKEIAATQE
ncbi:MAG: PIN domain-containing protein [Dehalococcoidia bacterium]|nr:PIN domain-containing protein [Dehalococcoidia bacterium]